MSWDCITGLHHGIILRDYVTELYYGIILRSHITECYYGILLRTRLYEKDAEDARDVPVAAWDPGDPLGTGLGPRGRLGTPLGIPRDARRTPRDPGDPHELQKRHISTNLQRQSSRLLHLNLLVATHPATTPLDCFVVRTLRTEPFLVGHRAGPEKTQGFMTGRTPHRGRRLPIRSQQGQAPLIY